MQVIDIYARRLVGVLAALVVLVLVVGTWVLTRSHDRSSVGAPSALPSSTPSPSAAVTSRAGTARDTSTGRGAAVPGPVSGAAAKEGAGMTGGSRLISLPKHQLVVRVTSETEMFRVGYVVPTSLEKSYGVEYDVGRTWELRTVVYGKPQYARIYLQAGPYGIPVKCTITVDGKVLERRETEGPWGQLICQG